MRTRGIVAGAGGFALAAGMLITPVAGADAPVVKLGVHPAVVAPGGVLTFVATCQGAASAVTSAGLVAPLVLKGTSGHIDGQGEAVTKVGRYTAQLTCTATPTDTNKGGTNTAKVTFEVACPKPPATPTTEPTKPTEPTRTTEPTTPSTSTPAGGGGAAAGHPAQTCGTTPPPPVKKPAKPQVTVTPKGAPQTGDGSLSAP